MALSRKRCRPLYKSFINAYQSIYRDVDLVLLHIVLQLWEQKPVKKASAHSQIPAHMYEFFLIEKCYRYNHEMNLNKKEYSSIPD